MIEMEFKSSYLSPKSGLFTTSSQERDRKKIIDIHRTMTIASFLWACEGGKGQGVAGTG